jgi:alkanesulfonate monooxygenase SsuD/methylene tetrahydromethanopterin reductase-like flavin-dependent oxidoreductase (luciferase family)
MSIRGKKVGFILPQREGGIGGETPRWTEILDLAKVGEALNFDSVWVVDHFLWNVVDLRHLNEVPPEGSEALRFGYWECWTLVSALAASTSRIEIGTLVSNTGYRNPALLARMAETVDEISGGRVILGLGAGAIAGEYDAFGYDFERRIGRFEEALQIIKPMLRGEAVTFDGEFYRTRKAELLPKGPRANGPPILVGVWKGGPRMKRLAVQHADHWNCWLPWLDSRVETYREAYREIVEACEKHGREPATLRKNAAIAISFDGSDSKMPGARPLTGSSEEISEELARYLEEDVDHIVVSPQPNTPGTIEMLARILESID